MSYDIYVKDPLTGDAIEFDAPHHTIEGTYQLGGRATACLNITYNYALYYYKYIDPEKGIRSLYGKTGREAIPILEKAIGILGTDRDDDYWRSTPGNAGAALRDLLDIILLCPDGIIDGD